MKTIGRVIKEFITPHLTVQTLETKPSENILGNHYHKKMTEVFTVMKGGGEFAAAVVSESGELDLDTLVRLPVEAGSVIRVPPYMSHTFILEPESLLHVYVDCQLDTNDLHPCPIPGF